MRQYCYAVEQTYVCSIFCHKQSFPRCPAATTDPSLAAPKAMRLDAMVPQKLLTNVSLHGRVETPPNYYCFRLCRTSTYALFNNITYKNCLVTVLYAETSILFYFTPHSHLDGFKQPRRRDLSNGPIMPHSAHVLVKQSFLNEGAVVEMNRDAFA